MNFYLVRHGEALAAAEHPQRPLSAAGRRAVAEAARLAKERGAAVSAIYHSGILRAQQTAEILGQFLAPPAGVAALSGLLPEDDPAIGRAHLEAADQPIMLVGHLPHMGRLAALLIHGDPERTAVDFGPGDIVCLSREGPRWRIDWHIKPPSS
ncbi:MAG TPA: phosphohistidine phosphatase SixA [Candidatus Binatia bacterium]|nr:phosphohistidine phosphatase SixA [Candidatus Binatia bacterium]